MKHVIESLPVLVLDVYSRCNCRCVMCDIWRRDSVREMHPDDLARQLPAIKKLGVRWVVLTGGEPLMHSRLFDLCAPLKQLGIRLTLLTTGLLLSRFADDVVREIDDVIVSLDGPPAIHDDIRRVRNAFDLLSQGIRDLRHIAPEFPVSARCTVQRRNAAHLTATIAAVRQAGCDSISFLAADTHSMAFNRLTIVGQDFSHITLLPDDLDVLRAEVDRVIDSGECGGFVADSPEKLKRIVSHFACAIGIRKPVAPVCNAPWVSAVLETDGAVRPCFFHSSVGRVTAEAGLDSILNGPEAVAFRTDLNIATNPICRNCVCSLNWKG